MFVFNVLDFNQFEFASSNRQTLLRERAREKERERERERERESVNMSVCFFCAPFSPFFPFAVSYDVCNAINLTLL